MGKNKLHTRNPSKSGNPIYKKAGAGAPLKAKTKVKPVKTNLKQLKIANKEAIASLDKKLGSFHKAMQTKGNSSFERPVRLSEKVPPPVKMEETSEKLPPPVKMEETSEKLPPPVKMEETSEKLPPPVKMEETSEEPPKM